MFDVADLTRQCRKAAADEVAFASDDELLAAVVELQAARSAFEAAEAHVLGELQVRGVTDRCFGLKTAKWVAAQAKVDHRPVGRRSRLGLWLRQLAGGRRGGGRRVDHRRSRRGAGRGGGEPADR